MRRLKRLAIVALLVVACARMAAPPGGPPRLVPPRLLSIYPDSGIAPCDFRGEAAFQFDEVTNEGATPNFGDGRGDLEKLILFSPDTAVPVVEWHRDRITVRPRRGWQANQTYRIELLPGLADLRQNISRTGHTIAFAICGPAPTRTLSGRVVDWTTARPAPGALIDAYHLPDSARYRTIADSTGRFRLSQLPDGPYLVVAVIDQSHDHRRQPAEPWDTVRVDATRDTVGEIWTFPRDTVPLRILDATRQDSVSIQVTFARPLDPELRLDSTSVRVRLLVDGDSVSIGTRYAFPKALFDSMTRLLTPRTPRADSVARVDSLRKDSVARATPAPVARPVVRGVAPRLDTLNQKRPPLGTVLVIRTVGIVQLGKHYVIDIKDVRTPDGRVWPAASKPLNTPNPPSAADSAKARADSLKTRTRADSIARADSLRKAARPDSGGRGGR